MTIGKMSPEQLADIIAAGIKEALTKVKTELGKRDERIAALEAQLAARTPVTWAGVATRQVV